MPVLRAGLGMVDSYALTPRPASRSAVRARRGNVEPTVFGVATGRPDTQPVMVLDPMLATGGSMAHTIGLLRSRNRVDVTAICVVAPEGVAAP